MAATTTLCNLDRSKEENTDFFFKNHQNLYVSTLYCEIINRPIPQANFLNTMMQQFGQKVFNLLDLIDMTHRTFNPFIMNMMIDIVAVVDSTCTTRTFCKLGVRWDHFLNKSAIVELCTKFCLSLSK